MGTGLGKDVPAYRGLVPLCQPRPYPVWGSYQAIKNLVCLRMMRGLSVYYRRAVGQGQEVGVCCPSVGFTPCGLELRYSDGLYFT